MPELLDYHRFSEAIPLFMFTLVLSLVPQIGLIRGVASGLVGGKCINTLIGTLAISGPLVSLFISCLSSQKCVRHSVCQRSVSARRALTDLSANHVRVKH